jgi:hypothetical protein
LFKDGTEINIIIPWAIPKTFTIRSIWIAGRVLLKVNAERTGVPRISRTEEITISIPKTMLKYGKILTIYSLF